MFTFRPPLSLSLSLPVPLFFLFLFNLFARHGGGVRVPDLVYRLEGCEEGVCGGAAFYTGILVGGGVVTGDVV